MKVSAILAVMALTASSSAYTISVYSKDNYQGTQKSWSGHGTHNVGFTVKSWIWNDRIGDGCCVNFCKGGTVSDLLQLYLRRAMSNSSIERRSLLQ